MKKTLILLAMVAALMILPFFINHGGEFGGSDGALGAAVIFYILGYARGRQRRDDRV
ncbi:MAG: energy-coupling factor ABC transporter substrate-binding protein [Klebsiella pneumoniae]|nr:energy-coupling factor ABC transporter substrate-binding protein [Klebsiella pneumoniae]